MPGLFFWNLYGRQEKRRAERAANVLQALTRLAGSSRPLDVLVFSECAIPDADILASLNAANNGIYVLPPSRSRRIRVWTRLPPGAIEDRYNNPANDRITIRQLTFPNARPVLLVGCHLVDRQTVTSEYGRADEARLVAEKIQEIENRLHNHRTILLGDLNMNPYEAGVVGPRALAAVMTRELARTVTALVSRQGHSCFYNPMWSCLGDRSPGPPGSHYWTRAEEPTNHFWQLYDQILVRPDLMDRLVRVEILDSDGTDPLVTRTGRPRATTLSDHLPVWCELNPD